MKPRRQTEERVPVPLGTMIMTRMRRLDVDYEDSLLSPSHALDSLNASSRSSVLVLEFSTIVSLLADRTCCSH